MTARSHQRGRDDVTAIVLAGGRSARFGGPKLEATIDGATILDRALGAADEVASVIILAGPAPARHTNVSGAVRPIPDDDPFAGPLSAVTGALHAAATELVIVIGGDMPALVPAVLDLLLDRLHTDPSVDAAILAGIEEGARTQSLPLALRVEHALEAASEALAVGDRSLLGLLGCLRSAVIPAEEWRLLDPTGATLLDIDVPADLDRARGNEIR